MIISKLKYDNLKLYEDKIISLLAETFVINFDISHEESIDLSKEKVAHIFKYVNDGSAILLGAIEDEVLLGFVWVYIHDFFGEKRLHINQIAVNVQHRGNGIGSLLIQEVEKQAVKEDTKAIDLFVSEANSAALNLYYRLGFETERRYMKKRM